MPRRIVEAVTVRELAERVAVLEEAVRELSASRLPASPPERPRPPLDRPPRR